MELSEQAQRYVKLAVATLPEDVIESDVYRIVAAMQQSHVGPLYMAQVAEAVEYGSLARLRSIAGGEHVNAAFCARAAQVLKWVEELEA